MDAIASHTALTTTLQLAVPLLIDQLARLDERTRDQIRVRWAADAATEVGSKGDVLQFGGKPGRSAEVFNHLARGLAALAWQPGGVTFAGMHWCAERPEPQPKPEPTVPTFRGRPVETVHPSGVL